MVVFEAEPLQAHVVTRRRLTSGFDVRDRNDGFTHDSCGTSEAITMSESEPVVNGTNGAKSSRQKVSSNEIRGVIRAKIDLQQLRETAAKVTGSSLGSVETIIPAIVEAFEKTGVDLFICDDCHGRSPVEYSEQCPFCGTRDKKSVEASVALAKVDAKRRAELAKNGQKFNLKSAQNAEKEFLKYRNEGAGSFWEMGRIAAMIQSNRLWALWKDDQGKDMFPSFEAYCLQRFGFRATHAFRMIKIALSYSKEDAENHSIRALFAVRDLPDSQRSALLASGESGEKLSKKAQKLKDAQRKKTGEKKRGPKGRPESATTFVFDAPKKTAKLVDEEGKAFAISRDFERMLKRKPRFVLEGVSEGTSIAFGLVAVGGSLGIRFAIEKE